jgi:hypothetical protein
MNASSNFRKVPAKVSARSAGNEIMHLSQIFLKSFAGIYCRKIVKI